MHQFQVFIEVRRDHNRSALKKFIDEKYIVFDSDEKITAYVPVNWDGFKNGTIRKILQEFNDAVYLGVMFLTDDRNTRVFDFDDNELVPYDVSIEGKKYLSYVKKKLGIFNLLDPVSKSFTFQKYMLNIKYSDPITKVLDIYSVGVDSQVLPETFVSKATKEV